MARQLFFLLFILFPFSLFAQKTISGDFQDRPLAEVVYELQEQHQLIFSYTVDLKTQPNITASFHKQFLDQALNNIFKETTITFEIVDETYIVLREKEGASLLICGKVMGVDKTALPYANILSLSTLNGTSTDEAGHFEWRDKVLLTDTLEITYLGYQPFIATVSELSNCPLIHLKPQAFSFSEVLVKEYITSGIEQSSDLDHVVLHPNQLSVVPGLTEADVLQMVQILPGVQSLDESATGLHIRGGTSDQNLILWDGIPVYNSGHFFGMISAFNPYIVEEVKVFRGGFGAEYGGRVSGVIDISSVNKIPDRVKVKAGINFTHTDVAVAIPLFGQKSALVLSGRRAYTDIIESPTYKKLSQRVFQKGQINDTQMAIKANEEINYELDFNFTDLNAKWLWKPDDKNKLSFSFFNISDELDYFVQNIEDNFSVRDKIKLKNWGLSSRWERQWKTSFSSKAIVSFTDLENAYNFSLGSLDSLNLDLATTQVNDINDFTFQQENTWNLNNSFELNFGYQLSHLNVQRSWFSGENEDELLLDQNTIHNGHLTLITHLKNQWRLNTGLRWSFANALKQAYWEPRFSIHFLPNEKWQFKGGAGLYHQFMSQVIELNDLGLNERLWVLTDGKEEIPISRSEHYSTGFLFHTTSFQLEVEGYYKRLFGLTSFSPIFINNFQGDDYSEGTGTAWGLDVLLKKKWKAYQTWLSYSYSRVFYTFDIFSENQPFSAPHDRPHSLTSMHQFKYKNWNFSLSWKYASGKVYTEAEGFFIDEDEVFPEYSYHEANENRLPVFHRLDASILYRIIPDQSRMRGTIGLSILNIYNRKNILSREYLAFYEEEEEEYVLEYLDRPMLRFTPNVVIRLSW